MVCSTTSLNSISFQNLYMIYNCYLLQIYFLDVDLHERIHIQQVIEEFNTQLIRELDYNFEAMNAIKFKKMFEDSKEVYIIIYI